MSQPASSTSGSPAPYTKLLIHKRDIIGRPRAQFDADHLRRTRPVAHATNLDYIAWLRRRDGVAKCNRERQNADNPDLEAHLSSTSVLYPPRTAYVDTRADTTTWRMTAIIQ